MIFTSLPERILALRDELFGVDSKTCFERARIITRSYKASEGEPMPIRRGKAVADIFSDMPIYIRPCELIVGSRSSILGCETAYPEYDLEADKEWPAEVKEYWEDKKTLAGESRSLYPPIIPLAEGEYAAAYTTGTVTGLGHVIVDYEKAVTKGFRAIINEAKESLAAAGEDTAGKNFLTGLITACEGFIVWANRYADLAECEAEGEACETRRAELHEIARICRRVPEYPAESYREALQAFWFTHIAMHIEQKGWSISAGRFDQYIYPFYKADIDGGRITKEEGFELLLNLWVKFMENVDGKLKRTIFQNMTLGGRDMDGNDMSNELSHLCLDATMLTGFTQPALSARWHTNADPDFWAHAMECISTGVGMPALFNDEIIIKIMIAHGVSPEDAANYGIVGCVEPSVPGKEPGMTAGGHINLAKALELALFDGRSLISGVQIGPHTGNAADFISFDEIWEAYAKQSRFLSAVTLTAAGIAGDVQKKLGHCPLMSSVIDDCITRRKDLVEGGSVYSLPGCSVLGSTNACDGLLALRKFVFEEKRYTMAGVCRALEADFEGYEDMRQVFLNSPYRFGNDIPEVDETANRVNAVHAEFVHAHPGPRGGHFTCGVWPVDNHVDSGFYTGALPDGRRKGMPIVDGVGACQGADVNGPTALIKSVARLNNFEHWTCGNTCNIKFSRTSVTSPNGLKSLGVLASVFMELGGQELQINVVDAAVLRAAQEKPEEFDNLVVRVAGFSAYFNTLRREVQNEIISRMEQMTDDR